MTTFKQFSEPGDVYLTRNIPEYNESPGYWQHVVICNGMAVIEAQAEPGCVIMVDEECFRRRNPEWLHLRNCNVTPVLGSHLAILAQGRIGTPYDKRKANCVTLVREVYNEAFGLRYTWLAPSGIARDTRFKSIEHHKDYEHWVKPADWYEGRSL